MARLIQTKIKEPLAEEVLFGKLQAGGSVVIDAAGDELKLTCHDLNATQGDPNLTAPEVVQS
jgi:ATP-dependent Clp protease ATP-binding subunit ClpA